MTSDWQRLEQVIKWSGKSVHSFAMTIGLSRADNLYNIKKGKHKLSADLSESIVTYYEKINKQWLLSGEGEMLNDKQNTQQNTFPYYAKDINLVEVSQKSARADFMLTMPFCGGCDFAAINMSDAMLPEIPLGAIVMLYGTQSEDIIYGKSYYVATDKFKGIRKVRSCESDSELKLEPINTASYDPLIINKQQIQSLYLVKGVIIDKTL